MDFSNMFQNNPAFANLTPEKIAFLQNFASASKPTDMRSMLPFLMSTMNNAKKENIQFSETETDLLIQVLKMNLSPEETERVDKVMNLIKERKSGS